MNGAATETFVQIQTHFLHNWRRMLIILLLDPFNIFYLFNVIDFFVLY